MFYQQIFFVQCFHYVLVEFPALTIFFDQLYTCDYVVSKNNGLRLTSEDARRNKCGNAVVWFVMSLLHT